MSAVGRIHHGTEIMKQITKVVFLTAVGLLFTGIVAAENVERTIDASPDGKVSISNIAGLIEVLGWSRDQVEVIADLGRGVDELIVERHGDEIIVKVKVPRHNSRSISSELTIRVPENSSIEVAGVSADIEVNNVYGELRLHTVSGDMSSDVFGSDIQIETVSGDIELQGDHQAMTTQASSVSGDIETDALEGNIQLESVSGDLVFSGGSFDRVQAVTVNGDIVFNSELRGGGKLEIETINGEVDIDFKNSISAKFDIETFNGDIYNCFGPEAVRASRYAPGRELNFTEGDGDSRVVVETLNGDITICRD